MKKNGTCFELTVPTDSLNMILECESNYDVSIPNTFKEESETPINSPAKYGKYKTVTDY